MSKYLDHYREDGFFLRMKNLVLTDHYIGDQADLYLAFTYVEEHEHEASFFEGFDIRMGEFVMKIMNDSLEEQQAIVKAFERYLTELSPATILINKANFLEINDHNGSEHDEGWACWFGSFSFRSFEIYSNLTFEGYQYRRASPFRTSSALLQALSERQIDIAGERQLVAVKFGRLIRMLNLCVSESIAETVAFLNGYYLQRPDEEMMRSSYGEDFDMAMRAARDIIGQLSEVGP